MPILVPLGGALTPSPVKTSSSESAFGAATADEPPADEEDEEENDPEDELPLAFRDEKRKEG